MDGSRWHICHFQIIIMLHNFFNIDNANCFLSTKLANDHFEGSYDTGSHSFSITEINILIYIWKVNCLYDMNMICIWYDMMIWCDMMRYMRYDMIWYDKIWYDAVWKVKSKRIVGFCTFWINLLVFKCNVLCTLIRGFLKTVCLTSSSGNSPTNRCGNMKNVFAHTVCGNEPSQNITLSITTYTCLLNWGSLV